MIATLEMNRLKVFWLSFAIFLALPPNAITDQGSSIMVGYAGFLIAGAFLSASVIVATSIPTSFSVLKIDELSNELGEFLQRSFSILTISIASSIALFVLSFNLPSVDHAMLNNISSDFIRIRLQEAPSMLAQTLALAAIVSATDKIRTVIQALTKILSVSGNIARDAAKADAKNRVPSGEEVKRMFDKPEEFARKVKVSIPDHNDKT